MKLYWVVLAIAGTTVLPQAKAVEKDAAKIIAELRKNETFERIKLDSPVFVGKEPIEFALDGETVWIGEGILPIKVDLGNDSFAEIDWPVEVNRHITDIAVGTDWVCFATDGAGIVVHEKKSGKSRLYGKEDKLFTLNVRCLHLQGSKLWVGYDFHQYGGVSQIDLISGEIKNLSPPLFFDPKYDGLKTANSGPPINSVMGITTAHDGTLWAAVEYCGLFQFDPKSEEWKQRTPTWQPVGINCLVVTEDQIVLGAKSASRIWGDISIFSYDLSKEFEIEKLAEKDEMQLKGTTRPLQGAFDMAVDGNDLWIASMGYFALRDVRDGTLKRLCNVRDPEILFHAIELSDKHVWVAAGSALFRLPR